MGSVKEWIALAIIVAGADVFRVARELARREGIFGGIASGTAVHAALAPAAGGFRGTIATVLPGRGERHLGAPHYPAS